MNVTIWHEDNGPAVHTRVGVLLGHRHVVAQVQALEGRQVRNDVWDPRQLVVAQHKASAYVGNMPFESPVCGTS
jgi:hypothetical protein